MTNTPELLCGGESHASNSFSNVKFQLLFVVWIFLGFCFGWGFFLAWLIGWFFFSLFTQEANTSLLPPRRPGEWWPRAQHRGQRPGRPRWGRGGDTPRKLKLSNGWGVEGGFFFGGGGKFGCCVHPRVNLLSYDLVLLMEKSQQTKIRWRGCWDG